MSFEKHPHATATFGLSVPTELEISGGSLTMNKAVVPYVSGTVTVPLTDEDLVEELDPYAKQRVLVEATNTGPSGVRAFDLVMTNRTVDHASKTVDVEVASDEALLLNYSPIADSIAAFANQSSLRAIINGVLSTVIPGKALETSGAPDVPFWTYTDATNLITDPGTAATGGGGYGVGNANADWNDTTWSISGDGDSYNIYNPTNVDSYMSVAGATGSLFPGLTPGKTYVLSATGNVKAAFTGTNLGPDLADGNGGSLLRTRALVVHTRVGTAAYAQFHSPQVPNTVNTPTRVSVEFTVPEGATEVFFRAYLGNTAGQIRWDGFRLSEKDTRPGVDNTVYFDGDTTDTAEYSYVWDGAQDNSKSRRIALIDRAPELLVWKAGTSAWDFLEPLISASQLWLHCDESRKWWLLDPSEYALSGRVVAQVSNTTQGRDVIDTSSALKVNGVIARFSWRDNNGDQQTKDDTAGTAGLIRIVEFDRPYPGPGTANMLLQKLTGQGRTQEVTVGSDFSITPGQEIGISLPGTYDQVGTLQGVTWYLADGLMDLQSSGLVTIPDGAIDLLPGTIDALSGTIDSLN